MPFSFGSIPQKFHDQNLNKNLKQYKNYQYQLQQLASILITKNQAQALHSYKGKLDQLKKQVTEGSIKLEDFYELRSFKSKVSQIDNENLEKIRRENQKIDLIQNQFSGAMAKLKNESINLSQQLANIQKKKSQQIVVKLNKFQDRLEKISKKQQGQNQMILKDIDQKNKILKKQLINTSKQINSSQSLLRLKFNSLKRNMLRTVESQSQRRQTFNETMYKTISQITQKAQKKLKNNNFI